MKGFTLERDLVIKIVLVVAVLAVIAGLVFTIIQPNAKDMSLKTSIARLCPQWIAKNCDMNSAYNDLMIDDYRSLAALCSNDFGAKITDWFNAAGAYEHCKSLCIACPD